MYKIIKTINETQKRITAKELENEFERIVYSNLDLFDTFEDRLPNYYTILIDEDQDFK